jgi:phosphomevalonate kinase
MELFNQIPSQWLILGLFGVIGLQTILMMKLFNKQNKKIDASFLTLERHIKARLNSAAENIYQELQHLASYQNESFQTIDEKLSRIEKRSFSDIAKSVRPSASPLDRKHQVVSLAQMGMDSKGISKRLRLSRGEAELLLSLKDRYSAENEDGNRAM